MPSNTFLNLPKEKRKRIVNAALDEFTNVSISEASINQIIKKATISRGSFYTYFDSKEDIFNYVLNTFEDDMIEKFKLILIRNNGDLFSFFDKLFYTLIHEITEGTHSGFLENAFNYLRFREGKRFNSKHQKKFDWQTIIIMLDDFIKKDNLNIQNPYEYDIVVEILINMTMSSIFSVIHKHIPLDDGVKEFKNKLTLVKKGLEK